jgi:hypothetical protein
LNLTQGRTAVPPALSIPCTGTRSFGVKALIVGALILGGASSPAHGQSSSSNYFDFTKDIVGIGIGVGAVVAVVVVVAVNHSHHVMSGCVLSGPNGLELQTAESKIYALEGDSAGIKVGERVKIHGSKVKKAKDASGTQVFKVEQLKKDYGPCHVDHAANAKP